MKNKINRNQLGRTKAHRKAMLQNMAMALIKHERIKTTKAKATELKKFIEPLITRAKENTLHNRRIVHSRLRDKTSLIKLFEELGPRFKERPGGYTRRYLLGKRQTDSAEMVFIEFVGENMDKAASAPDTKKTKTSVETKPETTVETKSAVETKTATDTTTEETTTTTEATTTEENS